MPARVPVPKPGLREANSIEADDKESAVAAYYQQYGYGAAQSQQGYYGQQAGKGPAVLVSSQVRLQMNCYSQSSSPTNRSTGAGNITSHGLREIG